MIHEEPLVNKVRRDLGYLKNTWISLM
jgi:hypothetical protein